MEKKQEKHVQYFKDRYIDLIRCVFGSSLWNLCSSRWNVSSIIWNVDSIPRNGENVGRMVAGIRAEVALPTAQNDSQLSLALI